MALPAIKSISIGKKLKVAPIKKSSLRISEKSFVGSSICSNSFVKTPNRASSSQNESRSSVKTEDFSCKLQYRLYSTSNVDPNRNEESDATLESPQNFTKFQNSKGNLSLEEFIKEMRRLYIHSKHEEALELWNSHPHSLISDVEMNLLALRTFSEVGDIPKMEEVAADIQDELKNSPIGLSHLIRGYTLGRNEKNIVDLLKALEHFGRESSGISESVLCDISFRRGFVPQGLFWLEKVFKCKNPKNPGLDFYLKILNLMGKLSEEKGEIFVFYVDSIWEIARSFPESSKDPFFFSALGSALIKHPVSSIELYFEELKGLNVELPEELNQTILKLSPKRNGDKNRKEWIERLTNTDDAILKVSSLMICQTPQDVLDQLEKWKNDQISDEIIEKTGPVLYKTMYSTEEQRRTVWKEGPTKIDLDLEETFLKIFQLLEPHLTEKNSSQFIYHMLKISSTELWYNIHRKATELYRRLGLNDHNVDYFRSLFSFEEGQEAIQEFQRLKMISNSRLMNDIRWVSEKYNKLRFKILQAYPEISSKPNESTIVREFIKKNREMKQEPRSTNKRIK